MHKLATVTIIFLLQALLPASAAKQALVVGIDAYDNFSQDKQLVRATADARSVAGTLQSLGFEAKLAENVRRIDFMRNWQSFLDRISPGDVAVLFFAGHGVEVGGLNFLLARDTPHLAAGQDEILKSESLSLANLLDALRARRPSVTLVIIDACRDNPFERRGSRSLGTGRGLGRIEPPEGMFVMFSAGAGETALDVLSKEDGDRNSVFTRTLLPLLSRPELTLPEVAQEVRRRVRELTIPIHHRQTPAYYDEIVGRFCLAGCATNTVSGVTAHSIDHPIRKPSISTTEEPPVNDCDLQAASPDDASRKSAGVQFKKIPPTAVAVCRSVQTSFPSAARFSFQLGRALGASGQSAEAAKWFRVAAEGGHVEAMNNLGFVLANGIGVERDEPQSISWYRRAAELGFAGAMHNLGVMLEKGRGVSANPTEAAKWYKKGAEAGHATAMNNYGFLLMNGTGVPANDAEAVFWLRRAAESGSPSAMYNLAQMLIDGRGSMKDASASAQWVVRSIKAGHEFTRTELRANALAWGEDFRRALQKELRSTGVYSGAIDGSFGAATQRAIDALFGVEKR